MKVYCFILLLISLIFLPQPSFSKKAKTIDELVRMYDITPCAECHEDKFEEWKSSSMGNSVVDPRVLRGWRTFIKLELDQEETLSRKDLTICLDCHVPHIKDAAPELVEQIAAMVITAVEDADQTKRDTAKKELAKLNLNCLGCHNLRAKGFEGKPQKNAIYVPNNADNPAHEDAGYRTIKSGYLKTSDFCAQCHHCPPSVPWEQCPTLYTSYIEDFINKGRKETCQDCHMKGEHDDHIHRSHRFFGPSNPDFLKSSIALDLNVRSTKYIDAYEGRFLPAIVVKSSLTNNAGHVMPHG